jgi:hypothetical protein
MKQSIPDGTKCKFSFRDLESECLDCFPEIVSGTQITEEQFKALEGQTCVIVDLETASEIGIQEAEYYNIKFDGYPETILVGMSGYHLLAPEGKWIHPDVG